MKKEKLIFIIGIFFLLYGVILFLTNNKKVVLKEESVFTDVEAIEIVKNKIEGVLNIYENPSSVFKVKDSSNELYYIAEDYNEVIKNKVSDKYIKEIEKTKINNKVLIKKNNDEILILKPIANMKYALDNLSVELKTYSEKEISGIIKLFNYKLNEKDEIEYLIYEKDIKLIKNGDFWLIDEFIY